MPYFKVVDNVGGSLVSTYTAGALKATYVPGQRFKPPVGKVFIFSDEQMARDWVGTGPQAGALEAWECDAEGVEVALSCFSQTPLEDYDQEPGITERVNEWWERAEYRRPAVHHDDRMTLTRYYRSLVLLQPPAGTLVADAVTLLRKLA